MAYTYNRRKKKKKKSGVRGMLWLTLLLLIAAIIVLVVFVIVKRVSSSTATTDLLKYYNLLADPVTGQAAATDNELAIVLNGEITEERAIKENGTVYINRTLMKKEVDSRFYYDRNEQIVLFTNAQDIYEIVPGENGYTVNDSPMDDGFSPAILRDGELYIALDFADELTCLKWAAFEDPARVVINTSVGEKQFVDTKKKTAIRVLGGPKSDIVAKVDKDVKLEVLEDLDDWYGVVSEEGWKGYVDAKTVSEVYTGTVSDTHTEPEYTSLKYGETIKLGWGGVYMEGGNSLYEDMVEYAGNEMNIFCPTWYYLEDNESGLTMYSEQAYVDLAHSDGYDVWALLADSNVSYEFVEDLLTHTSQRRELVERIMDDMIETGIDGLNLDLERIMSDYGDDFIQLVREFSIACRKAGKFFSVDNYAPYDFNACYHIEEQSRLCDYVMLMAYDDYLGSGQAGPNSSLPFIQEVTDMTVAKVDPSKLVVGLPFYSRLWYSEGGNLRKEEYNMTRARNIVEEGGGNPVWNSTLGLDEATYTSGTETVSAWLESRDSYEAKLGLLRNYNIAGIAFWTLGQEDEDVWEVIARY